MALKISAKQWLKDFDSRSNATVDEQFQLCRKINIDKQLEPECTTRTGFLLRLDDVRESEILILKSFHVSLAFKCTCLDEVREIAFTPAPPSVRPTFNEAEQPQAASEDANDLGIKLRDLNYLCRHTFWAS